MPTLTSVSKLLLNATMVFPDQSLLPNPNPHLPHTPPRTPHRGSWRTSRAKARGQALVCANAMSCLFAFSEPPAVSSRGGGDKGSSPEPFIRALLLMEGARESLLRMCLDGHQAQEGKEPTRFG